MTRSDINTFRDSSPFTPVPRPSVKGPLFRVITAALLVRVALFLALGDLQPYSSIRETYFATAAGLASGYGYVMDTPVATEKNNGFDQPITAVQYLRQREAAGGRVDLRNPFPKSKDGWIPATRHPHGYGTLIFIFYSLFNYTGALWAMHFLQMAADSLACAFLFFFTCRVWNANAGRLAAWLYALCPPALFLTQDLLPDAFHGFFISLVLAAAVSMRDRWLRGPLLAGAVLGIACYFRAEYLLLPGVLFLSYWASGRYFARAAVQAGAMVVMMLLLLSPYAFWMKSAIGQYRFTSTTGGGSMYVCLGEDTGNPWGIINDDGWIHDDARRRGYMTAWDPEVDRYYAGRFAEYVKTYPVRYLRTVLVNRLPLALAPPYDTGNRATRSEFNFTKYRVEEGLSRWGVLKKYPLMVLKYMWPQLAMLAYSGLLTLSLIALLVRCRHEWRRLVWIVMPWLYPVVTISLLKAVEPRNLASTLPALIAGAAILITTFRRNSSRSPLGRAA